MDGKNSIIIRSLYFIIFFSLLPKLKMVITVIFPVAQQDYMGLHGFIISSLVELVVWPRNKSVTLDKIINLIWWIHVIWII